MAFETFVPPGQMSFSPGTTEDVEPAVLTNQFGEGYAQRAPDGINSVLSTISMRFEVFTQGEMTAVLNFFKGKRGVTPFWFQLPGDASPRKWIATKWSRTWENPVTGSVTANLKEVVDPE